MLGVAHEVAAVTGESITEPDLSYAEEGGRIEDIARVEIADPDCARGTPPAWSPASQSPPSPKWLQDALLKSGKRPINNVVDVTTT